MFQLAAEGRSDEAIAQKLGITRVNVERELRNVFAKLGLCGTVDELRRIVALLEYRPFGGDGPQA